MMAELLSNEILANAKTGQTWDAQWARAARLTTIVA